MAHDDTIDQLNQLVHINKDGESGFLTAAENIKNSELETLFRGYSQQHAKFASELQQEIKRLGGDFADSGTLGGAIHRGWLDVKSALSGHSAAAILKSCESGEESAMVSYDRAADDNPTGQTNALLEKHRRQIKEFHTRLCRLISETKDGVDFQKNE
ncbi:MAG: PA2169 family four-helix-bundle protein [Acidobacteriaceae bacterium]|nr:PA2169 family four-helix-bundle protein [Acidobacteriaceae bacterium]